MCRVSYLYFVFFWWVCRRGFTNCCTTCNNVFTQHFQVASKHTKNSRIKMVRVWSVVQRLVEGYCPLKRKQCMYTCNCSYNDTMEIFIRFILLFANSASIGAQLVIAPAIVIPSLVNWIRIIRPAIVAALPRLLHDHLNSRNAALFITKEGKSIDGSRLFTSFFVPHGLHVTTYVIRPYDIVYFVYLAN